MHRRSVIAKRPTIVSAAAGAIFLALPAGCQASSDGPPKLTNERVAERAGESPLRVADRLAEQLRPKLAQQVAGNGAIAFGRDQIGVRGETLLVAAVTPVAGAFALIPLERIANGGGTVPVCYFELVWPDARSERSAAGMAWALRSLPDPDCTMLTRGSNDWERKSVAVPRTITARRSGATIVSAKDNVQLGFPPDLRAAIRIALRPGERLDRVAPLPRLHEAQAVGWTSRGRVLLAFPNGPYDVCVAEAPNWPDLAKRSLPVAQEIARRCDPLFAEVENARMKRLKTSPEQQPIILDPLTRAP